MFSGFLSSASLFFRRRTLVREGMPVVTASGQGLTLVHVSAQPQRYLWDRGCVFGLFSGCL